MVICGDLRYSGRPIIGVESENSRLSLVDTQIVVAVVRQSLNRQHRRMHCVELTVLSNIKLLLVHPEHHGLGEGKGPVLKYFKRKTMACTFYISGNTAQIL